MIGDRRDTRHAPSDPVPSLRELGVLWDYAPPAFVDREVDEATGQLRRGARALNVNIRLWMIRHDRELREALTSPAATRAQAMFVTGGPIHGRPDNSARIGELVRRRRLPPSLLGQANHLVE